MGDAPTMQGEFMLTKTKTSIAMAVASLAISIGAYAAPASGTTATDAPPPPPPGQHRMGPHGPGGPGSPGGPGFAHVMDHLHAQLKLNPQQEQAWQQAQATSRKNFDAMRTTHDAARQQLKDAASQPILDLSALQAQHEQLEASDHELRSATEKAFVDFYNTLNDTQKTIVSNDIKKEWRHMMDHPQWDRHHGPHDGPPPHDGQPPHDGAGAPGAGNDAPPPPPPASGS